MGDTGKNAAEQNARLQSGYGRGASAAQSGQARPTVGSAGFEASDLTNAWLYGFDEASQASQPAFQMPVFEMPQFDSSSSQQSQADFQAKLDAQAAENAKNQAISQMNDLYANRMNAANAAVDFIHSTIAQEKSDAALMGVDYNITEEDTANRINNYFASIWGEGDESSLSQLMGEYGAPKGHTEFTVLRGDASGVGVGTEGKTTTVSSSKGMAPKKKTMITGVEEGLGGSGQTVLGGL
jgi:hypothetical protein